MIQVFNCSSLSAFPPSCILAFLSVPCLLHALLFFFVSGNSLTFQVLTLVLPTLFHKHSRANEAKRSDQTAVGMYRHTPVVVARGTATVRIVFETRERESWLAIKSVPCYISAVNSEESFSVTFLHCRRIENNSPITIPLWMVIDWSYLCLNLELPFVLSVVMHRREGGFL